MEFLHAVFCVITDLYGKMAFVKALLYLCKSSMEIQHALWECMDSKLNIYNYIGLFHLYINIYIFFNIRVWREPQEGYWCDVKGV